MLSQLWISVELTQKQAFKITDQLRSFFFRNPGDHPVYVLILNGEDGEERIKTRYKIAFNDTIKAQLENIINPSKVNMGNKRNE